MMTSILFSLAAPGATDTRLVGIVTPLVTTPAAFSRKRNSRLAQIDGLPIAAALELYRASNGRYPDSLESPPALLCSDPH